MPVILHILKFSSRVLLLVFFLIAARRAAKTKISGLTGAYSTKESPFGLQKPANAAYPESPEASRFPRDGTGVREYCHPGSSQFSEAIFMPHNVLRRRQLSFFRNVSADRPEQTYWPEQNGRLFPDSDREQPKTGKAE